MEHIFYSYYIATLLKGKLKFLEISFSVLFFLCVVVFGFGGIIHFLTGNPVAVLDVLLVLLFIYSLMNVGYAAFNRYIPSAKTAVTKENVKIQLSEKKTEVELQEGKGAGNSILMYKRYETGIKSGPKEGETKKEEIKSSPKTVGNSILMYKRYETGIKSGPKEGETKKEEIKSSPKTVNNKKIKDEAPVLDINIDSTQDSFEEAKKEEHLNYSGVIDRGFEADPTDADQTEDAQSTETSSGQESSEQGSGQVFEAAGNKIIETPLPDTENGLYQRIREKKYN